MDSIERVPNFTASNFTSFRSCQCVQENQEVSKDFGVIQRRAQKFEKTGALFKAKPAGPDIVKKKKISHHALRCPIFHLKTSEEQKRSSRSQVSNFPPKDQ